jgi:lactam utilization protein B
MLELIDINCDMGESFGNWNMGDDKGMRCSGHP